MMLAPWASPALGWLGDPHARRAAGSSQRDSGAGPVQVRCAAL